MGIVNQLAKRGKIAPKTEVFGKAFENWVFHELCCYRAYRNPDLDISYWALTTGIEVDFILDNAKVAIEAKGTDSVHSEHLKGLREFRKDFPECKNRCVVSLEKSSRKLESGIWVLGVSDFVRKLWGGELV